MMKQTSIGKKVPAFSVPATGNQQLKSAVLKGKYVVLYFYPRDNTPGCTLEGQDFRDHIEAFQERNTLVLGVSRDSLKSHETFRNKQNFPFDLIADEEEVLCTLFDVIKLKNMYGKTHRGIERSTFLIDDKGILRCEWRKCKVKGHVQEVLEALTTLQTPVRENP